MPDIYMITTIFAATEEKSTGIAALGIDPIAILASAGTFLVLFFVIKYFALNKIVDTLEKRRKTIDDGVRLGREMEAEKQMLDDKVEAALRKARLEADKIIAAGHEQSTAIIKEAEVIATRKTDDILAEARNRIDEDIQKARRDLEKDMRSLVAEATEVIIGEKLDANKDATLLERALKATGKF